MGKRSRVCIKKGAKTGLGRAKKTSCWYVERRRDGTIKKTTNIGRSIAVDKRIKAKFRPKKPGYGHLGDYAKKKVTKSKVTKSKVTKRKITRKKK